MLVIGRFSRQTCTAVFVLALMAAEAWSQQQRPESQAVPQSFEELQRVLKVGQKVVVTDNTGAETKGEVADLSASSLVVLTSERRTFIEDSVSTIRRRDSSWNGTLIGLGVGAAIAGAGMKASYGRGESAYGWYFVGSWLLPTIGAITGYVADKRTGNDPIYVAPPGGRSSLTISPFVNKAGLGLSASVRF